MLQPVTVTLVHPVRGERAVKVKSAGAEIVVPVHNGHHGDEFYRYVSPDRAVWDRTEWMPPLDPGPHPHLSCTRCGSHSGDGKTRVVSELGAFTQGCENCEGTPQKRIERARC